MTTALQSKPLTVHYEKDVDLSPILQRNGHPNFNNLMEYE